MAMRVRNPVKYLASVLVSCCFCFRVRRAKLTEHRKIANEGLQCFFREMLSISLFYMYEGNNEMAFKCISVHILVRSG